MAEALAHATHTAAPPLVWDPDSHLLARCTFGATPEDRSTLTSLGPDAWFAQQVTLGKQYRGYHGRREVFARAKLLRMTPYDLREWLIANGNEFGWDAMDQLAEVTLGLQAYSVAQLYEVLVDFFSNHLNVPNHAGDMWNTRADYDNNVIRRYALGSFSDMLVASCKHPAMLTYLSLCDSTKNTVNENYARELLELHTVGLHYSETDVKTVAKLLTGRTLDMHQHYVYDDYIHATGAVSVLGFTDPNAQASAGEAAGDALLRYLAVHPYTAQTIARKLCVRLVSDNPSSDLVAGVAQAYLDNNSKIIPTVQKILCSTEFWESRGLKTRRPAENLVAAVRAMGAKPAKWHAALQTMHWMCNAVGDTPLDWQAPDGYADVAARWRSSSALLQVWDYHLCFLGQWADGFVPGDVTSLYDGTPTTSGEAIDMLTKRLTGTTFASADRQALLTFLGDPSFDTLLSRSGMRWYALYLAGLILHSPYHALR
jgi:uncharacterized protein (DUF1800 family)